jgi:hypothetical protein
MGIRQSGQGCLVALLVDVLGTRARQRYGAGGGRMIVWPPPSATAK